VLEASGQEGMHCPLPALSARGRHEGTQALRHEVVLEGSGKE
jgi:hypothetical protein